MRPGADREWLNPCWQRYVSYLPLGDPSGLANRLDRAP